jgi:hypothetical protein
MSQDTVPNSNLRKLSENDINMISTLKAQEFQKQYGKETVNLGGKWDVGKKLSSRGWHVAARVGEKVGNEWSRGGVCRGKRV